MINVKRLVKQYEDITALTDISFEIEQGEFVAFVGGSGSGKSTLFRCLTLRERWQDGQYEYNGNSMGKFGFLGKRKIRKEWAFIEEKAPFVPHKTALKSVIAYRRSLAPLFRKLTGTTSNDEHLRAMDYLEKVGLLDRAYYRMDKLSGGERQRVAIAQALSKGAKIIVADDPTNGLDPHSGERVLEDLRSLCRNEGMTVLVSLPNVDWAERFCSRIIGLDNGQIVFDVSNRRLTLREKQLLL